MFFHSSGGSSSVVSSFEANQNEHFVLIDYFRFLLFRQICWDVKMLEVSGEVCVWAGGAVYPPAATRGLPSQPENERRSEALLFADL